MIAIELYEKIHGGINNSQLHELEIFKGFACTLTPK